MDTSLHIVDYIVVALTLIGFVVFGLSFLNKQGDTTHYFTTSGTMPTWVIGLSILATLISSVTFLAYPGAGFDSNWILLVQGMMVPIVLLFIISFIVPFYRKVIGISAYEYFEKRFGYLARVYTSLAFGMAHFSKMGTVFFLLALAISSMMGLNIYGVLIVLAIVVILYTMMGGIEAVMWLDVVQGILLMSGALIALFAMFLVAPVSPIEMIDFAWENNKIGFGPYDWDLTQLTFFVIAINGIFYAIQKYGTDQTIVQRFLTAKSDKEAIRASYIGVLLAVPVWALFMFVGTMLFSFYHFTDFALPNGIRPDSVFPHFITTQLPIGVAGLILSGLIAAALSSLDSDLNSLSAVGMDDFYKRFFPDKPDSHYLFVSRVIVAICGIAALGVSLIYVEAEGDTVLSIVFALYAIFSGGVAGVLLLGIFSKRANKQGLYIGIGVCILFTAWAMMTSQPIGDANQPLLDLGAYNFTHHDYMMGVYTHLIIIGVGYVASFMFPGEMASDDLTFYAYWKNRKKLKQEKY